MRQLNFGRVALAVSVIILVAVAGCKTSGVAVTGRGQVMNLDISVPTDLSEGETKEMTVQVANRGVNDIDDVIIEVEMPRELLVLSQVPSRGVEWTDRLTTAGTKIYQYRAGDIEPATSADVRYHVQASFGSLDRTGDIKVTAWSEDLPGDKLVETKFIKLRR